jgi:hypothetical protein
MARAFKICQDQFFSKFSQFIKYINLVIWHHVTYVICKITISKFLLKRRIYKNV